MADNSNNGWSREDMRRVLASTETHDFDGHTVFASLSPAQRLDALGQMIAVVAELRGLAQNVRNDRAGETSPDQSHPCP